MQLLSLCASSADATATPPSSPALPARTPAAQEPPEAFEPARGESGAVQPVVGISQRVKMRPGEKKDLGTLGERAVQGAPGPPPASAPGLAVGVVQGGGTHTTPLQSGPRCPFVPGVAAGEPRGPAEPFAKAAN